MKQEYRNEIQNLALMILEEGAPKKDRLGDDYSELINDYAENHDWIIWIWHCRSVVKCSDNPDAYLDFYSGAELWYSAGGFVDGISTDDIVLRNRAFYAMTYDLTDFINAVMSDTKVDYIEEFRTLLTLKDIK